MVLSFRGALALRFLWFLFCSQRVIHSRSRSYYLFFNYLFFNYLYGYAFWSYWSGRGVCVLVVENCPKSHKPVEISDLRLLTIQERGAYLESNAAQ